MSEQIVFPKVPEKGASDEDWTKYNKNLQSVIQRSMSKNEYCISPIIGSELRFLDTFIKISKDFPWFCKSYPNQIWTPDHYSAEFIAEMRARKVIYDEMGSSPVSSFSGSWSSGVFTLDNNTANVTMLAALAREYLYAGSPTSNWRLLNDGTYDYNITAISTSARTITVSTADHTPSGTSISIYRHRVYGSTTSARHFSEAGLGFYQAGGDKISGFRRLDQILLHFHEFYYYDAAGGFYSGSGFTRSYTSNANLSNHNDVYIVRNPVTDGVNSFRAGSKNEIEAGTLFAYIYVGEYTA